MVLKAASILGLLVCLSVGAVEKDWASVVVALKPKQGQNFEQDLQLAKALFSLERRIEALHVLNAYSSDERANRMSNLISTQFYNQETANAYYEAIRLIGLLKWTEAREKLEPALAKEPGNGLLLLRLIEVELFLKQKDALTEHLNLAQDLTPQNKELKIYSAKAALDSNEDKEAHRILSTQKTLIQSDQTLMAWWLESLLRLKKNAEIQAIAARLLKDHPNWSYPVWWMIKNRQLSTKDQKAFETQLEKNLKDEAKFNQELEAEGKRTQFYWVGYYSYESLKRPIELPNQTKSPSQ